MTDPHSSPGPPAWVYKRDGRLVPFDADKISRSLFAAGESLGRPDAFLARELTDGVVHFLSSETEDAAPSTAQVAELTAKVVRELGQPALAQAYASFTRPQVPLEQPAGTEITVRFVPGAPVADIQRACLRSYTWQTVFTRDLAAAQQDGLLTLTGLETPFELAGCALSLPPPRADEAVHAVGLIEAIEQARQVAGGFLAVDGLEYTLAHRAGADAAAAADYVRELGIGLRATGLAAIVNLNCATAPSWADGLAEGPLFAGQQAAPDFERLALLADALRNELLKAQEDPAFPAVRIDWHLAERDFLPAGQQRLLELARGAAEGARLAFTFDRPRRPVTLAEGVDRRHSAVLLAVGLHLPRLVRQIGVATAEPAGNVIARQVFLQKLGSLARLGLSAAVQKRDFLRRHGAGREALTRGFFLDRARLVVAPVGLDSVVRSLTGQGLATGGAALELGRQIVQQLRAVLHEDGGRCQLDVALEAPLGYAHAEAGAQPAYIKPGWPAWSHAPEQLPGLAEVAGLTAWDAAAPVKQQLRAAGTLHAAAETGTAAVFMTEGMRPGNPAPQAAALPELVADWLRWAWRQTDLVRVRFLPAGRDQAATLDAPQMFANS